MTKKQNKMDNNVIIKKNEIGVDFTTHPTSGKNLLKFLKGSFNDYENGNHFTTPQKIERLKWFYGKLKNHIKYPFNHKEHGEVVGFEVPKGILKELQLLMKYSITKYNFESINRNWQNMSMNYLNERKRYYRSKYPKIEEELVINLHNKDEHIEFLKEKIKDLETELQLLKTKIKEDEYN